MKFPYNLCIGDHLSHHFSSIEEGSQLLEDSVVSQQQLSNSSHEPFLDQSLVDEMVAPMKYSVDPTLPLESDLNTTQPFFSASSDLSRQGGILSTLTIPHPSHMIV